jgi:hypothetical protein
MTLDQAKQKILDRVLATLEGWERLSYHAAAYFVSTTTYTSMTCKALRGIVVCRDQEFFTECMRMGRQDKDVVTVRSDSEHPTTFITSNECPQLLEWWDRATQQSAEKRVIDFALSLT